MEFIKSLFNTNKYLSREDKVSLVTNKLKYPYKYDDIDKLLEAPGLSDSEKIVFVELKNSGYPIVIQGKTVGENGKSYDDILLVNRESGKYEAIPQGEKKKAFGDINVYDRNEVGQQINNTDNIVHFTFLNHYIESQEDNWMYN